MTWKLETLRTACDKLYCRDYRYRDGPKATLLDFVCDLEADDTIGDSPFDDDGQIQPEYFRRFIRGVRNKTTGAWIFTTPRPDRLQRITEFVDNAGMLSVISDAPHDIAIDVASFFDTGLALGRYADQALLSGAVRGEYIGSAFYDDAITNTIMICNFIAGEAIFRIREVSVKYRRQTDELDLELVTRSNGIEWDEFSVRDGFALFGSGHGVMFDFSNGSGEASSECLIGEYQWNNKGRRLAGFTAKSKNLDAAETIFRRCENPVDIELSNSILRSVA